MIRIYGASDDLIEIEGDIREEFSLNEEATALAFSDGTVLNVSYGAGGLWKITRLAAGMADFKITFHAVDAISNQYSDIAELGTADTEQIKWVVCGGQFVQAAK